MHVSLWGKPLCLTTSSIHIWQPTLVRPRPRNLGCQCDTTANWTIHLPTVGITAVVGFILTFRPHEASRRRPRRRNRRIMLALKATGSWHSGQSKLQDPDEAVKETVAKWRGSLGSDRPLIHVSRPPSPFLGASKKPDWWPRSTASREHKDTSSRTQQDENVAFGLVFVPHKWAADLSRLVVSIQERLGWPPSAPLIGTVTDGDTLCLGTAWQDCEQPAASARFLDAQALANLSQESVRFQDFILTYPLWSMQVYGGKVNGSMLAGRHFFGRESVDVGSTLIFGDSDFGMSATRRTMALLDMCYPFAGKAGFVMNASNGDDEQESCCLLGGDDGPATTQCGGCVALILPGSLGTAINFCGCEAIGDELEVFDADVRKGIIRTVGDGPRDIVPPMGERRPSIQAATAVRRIVLEAGVAESDVWIGLPRGRTRDSAQLRVAPGAGEWALFPWGIVSAEGSLVLKGTIPRSEGICERGIDRMQLFISKADSSGLGRLAEAYDLKAMMATTDKQPAQDLMPYATLCFAGGPGPCASIREDQLRDGVVFGSAVLGCPGTSVPFSADVGITSSMRVHRQAVGLIKLYSSPSLACKRAGALDTGDGTENG